MKKNQPSQKWTRDKRLFVLRSLFENAGAY